MGEQTMPPMDYWLTLAEVRARTTLSAATIYRQIKAGDFPPPAKLGPNCSRWRTIWIDEWEATRPGVAGRPQPSGPRPNEVARPEAAVHPPMTAVPLAAIDARRPRFRRHAWEPLTMTWEEVADRVFRRTVVWLREHIPPDFPRPDPVYYLFHVEAVEAWARRRWGVVPNADSVKVLGEAEAILLARVGVPKRPATRGVDAAEMTSGTQHRKKKIATESNRPNYGVNQLARRWNCSKGKVRSLLTRSVLPHFRVGTLVRVREVDVRAYEEQCRIKAIPAATAPPASTPAMRIGRMDPFRRGQEIARRLAVKKPP